ncbi:MAG TPA: UbiA family prenyltransferase [Verrucomicrobiae bacterium]|nr:UbiA family prenyltransferase [Verrucomicrobiae bacterium]
MPPPESQSPHQIPLAVDMDGTLIRTDMMWESLVRLLRRNPLMAVISLFALLRGRAHFKQRLAARVQVDPANVPYHLPFLDWLKQQKASGRKLVLATASDIEMARPVATHVGLFEEVLASDGKTNLRNAAKRHALNERFGEHGYDYAGNSHDDLGVWPGARGAVVVNATESLARRAATVTKIGPTFLTTNSRAGLLWRALRPHQWIKNLILFVPVLTAHQLGDQTTLIHAGVACVAFCMAASAVYLLNDLLDLDADRHHVTKRNRPFASGDLPLQYGLLGAPILLTAALALSWTLSPAFALVIASYSFAATGYSWHLKLIALLDVLLLAGLYTLRLVAGHVATGIAWSNWLLAFSMFIFLSLALMKRYQEIQAVREQSGRELKGRGYTAGHHFAVVILGFASGLAAVIVLGLYVNSTKVVELYTRPKLLLLACPMLLAWICRVWWLTYRGKMHDDPTAFAFKDWGSYLLGALTVGVMWLAT